MKTENDINKDKTIEELLQQKRKDKIIKIILIIIIILLLMFCWVVYEIGRIGYTETLVEPIDSLTLIKVLQDDIEITKNTQLNIFKNEKFDGEKIIAPQSEGTYQFCVKNETTENVVYHIKFLDEMEYPINMKYKLKMDNIYIRGNKQDYVDIGDLNVEDIIVTKDSINIFTLEWYWEDADKNDTLVGSQQTDQYYTLNLEIEANKYEE